MVNPRSNKTQDCNSWPIIISDDTKTLTLSLQSEHHKKSMPATRVQYRHDLQDHQSSIVCSLYNDIKQVWTCFLFVVTKPNHVLNPMGAGYLAVDLA